MKSLVFMVFMAVALAINSYAQKKTDRERDGLIRAVHKIRLEWTEVGERMWADIIYDEKGNKVSREDFHETGQLGKITFKYDASGKLLEITSNIGSQQYKSEFRYDDKGNLIAKTNYDGGGSPSQTVYKYDANGNNIETLLYDTKDTPYAKIISTFDADGKLIKSTHYNDDNSIKEILIQVYGKNGEKIGAHHLNAKERITNKDIFDENGRLVEAIEYGDSGQVLGRQVSSYDHYGNIENISHYDGEGSLEAVHMYRYEIDPNGNWIKKSMSIKDRSGLITSIPNSTITRVIVYY